MSFSTGIPKASSVSRETRSAQEEARISTLRGIRTLVARTKHGGAGLCLSYGAEGPKWSTERKVRVSNHTTLATGRVVGMLQYSTTRNICS